ncbi:MAG: hypothetical protein FWE82_01100 [Defluviitaleaceae bacterium]|nr:hypothetical protein [Defluviitaleaceae bacterium]
MKKKKKLMCLIFSLLAAALLIPAAGFLAETTSGASLFNGTVADAGDLCQHDDCFDIEEMTQKILDANIPLNKDGEGGPLSLKDLLMREFQWLLAHEPFLTEAEMEYKINEMKKTIELYETYPQYEKPFDEYTEEDKWYWIQDPDAETDCRGCSDCLMGYNNGELLENEPLRNLCVNGHQLSMWAPMGTTSFHHRYCTRSNCGYTESAAHNNKYYKSTTTQHQVKCDVCSFTKDEYHRFSSYVAMAANYHYRKCDLCSDIVELPHSYGNWQQFTSALHKRDCECGFSQTGNHVLF